jgi:hypothetical protein
MKYLYHIIKGLAVMITGMMLISCDGGGGDDSSQNLETAKSLDELLSSDFLTYNPALQSLVIVIDPNPEVPPTITTEPTGSLRISGTNNTTLRKDVLLYEKTGETRFEFTPTGNPTAQERLDEAVLFLLNGSSSGAAAFKQLVEQKKLPQGYPNSPAPFTDAEIVVMSALLIPAGADIIGETFITLPTGQNDFFASDGSRILHTNTSTVEGVFKTRTISGQFDEVRTKRKISFKQIEDAFGQGQTSVVPFISDDVQNEELTTLNTFLITEGNFELSLVERPRGDGGANVDDVDDDSVAP